MSHQPRLDWQMWFAALGTCDQNPWFISFIVKLLSGSKKVTALLKTDPFTDSPPRHIRTTLYRYRFTTLKEWWSTGAWWKREMVGEYCPIITSAI